MTVVHWLFPIAAIGCLGIAAAALARRARGRLEIAFGLGMLGFAAESMASWVLVTQTELPDERLLWLRLVITLGLVPFAAWADFIMALLATESARSRTDRLTLAFTAIGLIGAAAWTWMATPFQLPDVSAGFYAARLSPAGLPVLIVQMLGTVGLLGGLEVCLRACSRDRRWRLKYVILGLGVVFLVRFYLLSQILLFHVVLAAHLTTQAAVVVLGVMVMAISVARGPLVSGGRALSHSLVYRSAVLGVLGIYLFVVGALGWLLDRLGLSEELFWGSLLVFVSVAAGAALILSENARWRFKRFIALHVYENKYDYRAHWLAFTRRLGSTVALDDLAPQLLTATTDAVGAAKGVLYLSGDQEQEQHLAAALEVFDAPALLDADDPLVRRARETAIPVTVTPAQRPTWFRQAGVLVPLTWQGSLIGIMLLATERTGAAYTDEDLQFLATAGVQIAAASVTTRLSESVARSREFEAFHRLTSFVVHDLKNAVSSLSLLSQNALAHFDDPEFQRDAITTLSKTVERMRRLLQRLASTSDVQRMAFAPLDAAVLVAERVVPLVRTPRVRLKTELQPAPIVGDADALERVFQNLVINAVEALEGGGDLILRTATHGKSVVCQVIDTGCGMSADFLRHSLFVPFRSSKKGGWGIGLYHAREIVTAHGGRIDAVSEEGQGTTFTITLPLAAASGAGL
jgi:putative PEP-CTERM system histidine kinase